MAILYGFDRHDGFAMVDTDTRAYLYGYPSSPLQQHARRRGARKTADKYRAELEKLGEFMRRCANLTEPVNEAGQPLVERNVQATYDHIYVSLIAPQSLK